MQDITKQKNIESRMQNHKKLLTDIIKNVPYPILVTNTKGEIIAINESGIELSGKIGVIPTYSLIGETLNCVHSFSKGECGKKSECKDCHIWSSLSVQQPLQGKEIIFTQQTEFGPKELTFLLSTNRIQSDGNDIILITLIDISERKQIEQMVMDSLSFNQAIFNTSPISILVYNSSGQCLLANPAAEAIIGGTTNLLHAQDFRQIESWKNTGLIEYAEDVLKSDKIITKEVQLTTFFDKESWFEIRFSSFYSKNEKRLLIMATDVSERKEMERKVTEAEKMNSIGNLAGGVAHDMNNALASIRGFAEISLMNLEDGEKIQKDKLEKYLTNILVGVDRGSDLVKKLLIFCQRIEPKFLNLNLNLCVQEALEFFQNSIQSNITIQRDFDEYLDSIDGDAAQINQLIMNLYSNAADTMPNGGIISIQTKKWFVDPIKAKKLNIPSGDYVCLKIGDVGGGIDEEVKKHLFEPFFTTKSQEKGKGLGLALTYAIVHLHNGAIEVENIETLTGKGAQFTIYFPVGKIKYIPTEILSPRLDTEKGTALFIDDDVLLREIMPQLLKRFGYNCILAQDGQEGVEIYIKHHSEIDFVICDMQMPRMNGAETLKRIKEFNNEAIAVLTTGYGENSEIQKVRDLGIKEVLKKPFQINDLKSVIERVAPKK